MAERNVFINNSVAANATVNADSPVLPNGFKLAITRIQITDTSLTAKPSIVRILFGGVVLKEYAVTASTITIDELIRVVGDGVKFLRVQRQNTEAAAKVITVAITARTVKP